MLVSSFQLAVDSNGSHKTYSKSNQFCTRSIVHWSLSLATSKRADCSIIESRVGKKKVVMACRKLNQFSELTAHYIVLWLPLKVSIVMLMIRVRQQRQKEVYFFPQNNQNAMNHRPCVSIFRNGIKFLLESSIQPTWTLFELTIQHRSMQFFFFFESLLPHFIVLNVASIN